MRVLPENIFRAQSNDRACKIKKSKQELISWHIG